jgi:hypothetical protein
MKFKKNLSIYIITNIITNQKYVGQVSGRSVNSRWNSHLSAARNNRGYYLHEAIKAQGEDFFVCEHFLSVADKDTLDIMEKKLISEWNTIYPNGYNRNRGGSTGTQFGKTINFKGKNYISHSELSKSFDIDPQVFHQRITKYGWSIHEALEIKKRIKKGSRSIKFIIHGKVFESFREACKYYKLNEDKVRSRLDSGLNKNQAFDFEELPKRKAHNRKKIIVDGEVFNSIGEACNFFDVSKDRYYRYINRKDWSLEQIFKVQPSPRRTSYNSKSFSVYNLSFSSYKSADKYFNLYQGAFSKRIRLGWSITQAAGLDKAPLKKPKHPKSISITLEGKKYYSISSAAKAYGFPHQTIFKRLKKGKSMKEAFRLT